MTQYVVRWSLLSVFALLLAGCSSSTDPSAPVANPNPLNGANLNLIFVVSPDLAYQASGDVNSSTANLTNQGLQRSLLTAPFLQQQVLGTKNVTSIYALEPMTHLQTSNYYPDIGAVEYIQQFALLSQTTLSSDLVGGNPYSGQNAPINASYASGPLPTGVATPSSFCPTCQGLDFSDQGGDNEALVSAIVKANVPGYYVFSAPWETVSTLLANISKQQGYNLSVPTSYQGPNYIYAITVPSSGSVSLATYNSNMTPSQAYPTLPAPALTSTACAVQTPSSIQVTGGSGGAVIPSGINTNETLYLVRHAEAHPQGYWSDNNYVGAGRWRALDLPTALSGKVISPNQVWSMDPSQFSQGTVNSLGDQYWSSVAPALTVEPYAIANNLPYYLASSISPVLLTTGPQTSAFFFTGGKFSNQRLLLGWAYAQNTLTINSLLASYFPNGGAPTAPVWQATDYDSIWTIALDGSGNLTADFSQCEGINSATLPVMPPQF